MSRPLFDAHPRLQARLPHLSLAELPTPVEHWDTLSARLGIEVWAKRDDRTAGPDPCTYGGNKLRKLELVLGQAIRRGSRTTVTVGYTSSNHALCTAVHANRFGLRPVSLLLRQDPPTPGTEAKLLAQAAHGAELHLVDQRRDLDRAVAARMARAAWEDRRPPTYIPAGASSPLGAVGYVNAGYELAAQIASGALPEPARVYLPMGSLGTAAGLLVGLRAAGVPAPIHGIRVIGDEVANAKHLYKKLAFTLALLRRADPDFPHVSFDTAELWMRDDQFGDGYGRPTPASTRAAELVAEAQGVTVDATYSAKALAALVADAEAGLVEGPVLFWCTYDSRPLDSLAAGATLGDLPLPLRLYAEAAASV